MSLFALKVMKRKNVINLLSFIEEYDLQENPRHFNVFFSLYYMLFFFFFFHASILYIL